MADNENITKKITDTPDHTEEFDQADIAANKGLSILSYLGPLVFIPMFARKESKFAQYHVKQGFNLFVAMVVYEILNILLNLIKVNKTKSLWGVPYTVRVTPWPITLILALAGIAVGVLALIGIIRTAKGKAKDLPFIGNLDLLSMFKK